MKQYGIIMQAKDITLKFTIKANSLGDAIMTGRIEGLKALEEANIPGIKVGNIHGCLHEIAMTVVEIFNEATSIFS